MTHILHCQDCKCEIGPVNLDSKEEEVLNDIYDGDFDEYVSQEPCSFGTICSSCGSDSDPESISDPDNPYPVNVLG